MRVVFRVAVAAATAFPAFLPFQGAQAAATFGNVAGRWCSAEGTMAISPQRIVMTSPNGGPTRSLNIRSIAYTDSSILVHFRSSPTTLQYYLFTEFGAGSMQMRGPVRTTTLRRC